jgi:hypothetical protein
VFLRSHSLRVGHTAVLTTAFFKGCLGVRFGVMDASSYREPSWTPETGLSRASGGDRDERSPKMIDISVLHGKWGGR